MKHTECRVNRPAKQIFICFVTLLLLFSLLPHAVFAAEGENGKAYLLSLIFTDAAAEVECGAELVLRTPERRDFGYGAVRFGIEVLSAPENAEVRLTYDDDGRLRNWVSDRTFPATVALPVQEEANQHYPFTAFFSRSGAYSFAVTLRNVADGTVIQEEIIPVQIGQEVRAAESLILPQNVSMTVGRSQLLSMTVLPNGALIPAVAWSTSEEAVVTVTQDGVLHAVTPGTAAVTVTAEGGLTATCTVTVSEPVPETEPTTEPITEPVTEPVTEPATEPVIASDETDPGADETDPTTGQPSKDTASDTASERADTNSSGDTAAGNPPSGNSALKHDVIGDFAKLLLYVAAVLLAIAVFAVALLLYLRARARKARALAKERAREKAIEQARKRNAPSKKAPPKNPPSR